jgi:hypothetical protein
LIASGAAKLIKSLDFRHSHIPVQYTDATYSPEGDAVSREEQLATVWMAYIQDSGFSVNSYWSQSMDLRELLCRYPIVAEDLSQGAWPVSDAWQTVQQSTSIAPHWQPAQSIKVYEE